MANSLYVVFPVRVPYTRVFRFCLVEMPHGILMRQALSEITFTPAPGLVPSRLLTLHTYRLVVVVVVVLFFPLFTIP